MFNWQAVGIAALMISGFGAALGVVMLSLWLLKALLGPGWESAVAYFGGWGLVWIIAMGFWIKPKKKSVCQRSEEVPK